MALTELVQLDFLLFRKFLSFDLFHLEVMSEDLLMVSMFFSVYGVYSFGQTIFVKLLACSVMRIYFLLFLFTFLMCDLWLDWKHFFTYKILKNDRNYPFIRTFTDKIRPKQFKY